MRDPAHFLKDILDRISIIQNHSTQGKQAFFHDRMLQDSVLYSFMIIGEASKKIPESLKIQNPHISWRRTEGFRNVLIHNYSGVNLERVWNVILDHLPQLKTELQRLYDEIKPGESS